MEPLTFAVMFMMLPDGWVRLPMVFVRYLCKSSRKGGFSDSQSCTMAASTTSLAVPTPRRIYDFNAGSQVGIRNSYLSSSQLTGCSAARRWSIVIRHSRHVYEPLGKHSSSWLLVSPSCPSSSSLSSPRVHLQQVASCRLHVGIAPTPQIKTSELSLFRRRGRLLRGQWRPHIQQMSSA